MNENTLVALIILLAVAYSCTPEPGSIADRLLGGSHVAGPSAPGAAQ